MGSDYTTTSDNMLMLDNPLKNAEDTSKEVIPDVTISDMQEALSKVTPATIDGRVNKLDNPSYPSYKPETEISGGKVNYYLVYVTQPQREDQAPYQAECEDIIEALELNPDEANIFKEIWRSANARKNNGKPNHSATYGAEKIVHYAGRILRRLTRTVGNEETSPTN